MPRQPGLRQRRRAQEAHELKAKRLVQRAINAGPVGKPVSVMIIEGAKVLQARGQFSERDYDIVVAYAKKLREAVRDA